MKRSGLNCFLAALGAVTLAAGCGSSSPSGTGGSAGSVGAGGHGGTAAGGNAGDLGGAAGSIPGAGGTGIGGGSAGAAGGGSSVGGAGGGVSTGGAAGGSAGAGVAGTSGTAGAAGGKEGGAGGSAAGGSAAGGAGGGTAGPGKVGIVALTESSTPYNFPSPIGPMTITAAGAVATYALAGSGSNGCTTTTVGACQLYTSCAATTTTQPTIVDPGAVNITGLSMAVPVNMMVASGGYISAAYSSYLWTASTPATVTVAGSASVPAYTMTITAPNPITLTAPTASSIGQSGPAYTIARGTNLVVTWTGGVEGNVVVSAQSGSGSTGVSVTCTVAASTGTVTIPASVLGNLGATGSFTASVTTSATKTVSDWLMDFQATVGSAQGTATFN
ncbi:MAG TPA: hypothetical protein VGP07_20725 [Polyangia bacterium]